MQAARPGIVRAAGREAPEGDAMSHVNVEIKARCEEIDRVRRVLTGRGADFRGTDRQTDTYFRCPAGRLKLREGNIENALIHYDRQDRAGPKTAVVTLYRPRPDPALKDVLARALGVLVVVSKTREIYFIDNVKFHLDEVEGLGRFVEVEAIDERGDLGRERLLAQCREYMALLGVEAADLIEGSYSDMLLARRRRHDR